MNRRTLSSLVGRFRRRIPAPMRHYRRKDSPPTVSHYRRAMVLVLVMVVIALLTLGGMTFSEMMLTEHRAAILTLNQAQARASADSGLEAVKFFLTQTPDMQKESGGWYNNSQKFRGILVREDADPRLRGRFAIMAPAADDSTESGLRYGLEDESTKLNLNALMAIEKKTKGAGRDLLLGLPGMSEDIADAILDWMDEDDEPREMGAEADYYTSLVPGYAPKNGPLETIEELLLVRGVTPAMLFGADADRNGMPDSGDASAASLEGIDNSDGSMNRGWSAYLTLYSLEKNTRPDGSAKIDVNQSDMQTLYDELSEALGNEDWAAFIVAYRQNGPYTGTKPGEQIAGKTPDMKAKGTVKLKTVLDLIGARVQAKFPDEKNPIVLEAIFPDMPGMMNAYLPKLMENLSVNPAKVIPGRININQAPRSVLAGIPGLSSEAIDSIISQRTVNPIDQDPNRAYETWIFAEGLVTLDEMKALMPFVCGGGAVYRAQAVGYFDGGGPAARIEAVIDTTESKPKVIFWRDLTHLGRGYPLETLGIDAGAGQ